MKSLSPKAGLGFLLLAALCVSPVLAQEGSPSEGSEMPAHSTVAPAREMQHRSLRFHKIHTVNARNRHTADRFSDAPSPGQGRQVCVSSTAYCLRGFTSRGTSVNYGTVAVDPRFIPLGSRIYVPGYGWGRALDVGGAIRGNIIDVWLPSMGQCMQWGRRSVTITVLPPGR